MSVLNDGIKTLVSVTSPLIGLGSAAVKLRAMTSPWGLGWKSYIYVRFYTP
jgi:hypothetical protein